MLHQVGWLGEKKDCRPTPKWIDTTPALTPDIFGSLNKLPIAKTGDKILQLKEPFPDPIERRQGGEGDHSSRKLEAKGYNTAYDKCGSEYAAVSPDGGLTRVPTRHPINAPTGQTDHLFELQGAHIFFNYAQEHGLLPEGTRADDLWNQAIDCDDLRQEFINVLNNPVNFYGIDPTINGVKKTILAGNNVDWSKLDLAHAKAFLQYMNEIKKAYFEIGKRIQAVISDWYSNVPGIGDHFDRWLNRDHWTPVINTIRNNVERMQNQALGLKSVEVKLVDKFPEQGTSKDTYIPDSTCWDVEINKDPK